MPYVDFVRPIRWPDGRVEHVSVRAERVSGLMIHRDNGDPTRWNVTLPCGRILYRRLATRGHAREAAKYIRPLIHARVMTGEWDGKRWLREQPTEATRVRRLLVTGRWL